MAFNPCVSCRNKFIGSTTYTYMTWWDGSDKFSYRFRQCVACASDLRNRAIAEGDVRCESGDWSNASEQLLELSRA